MIRARSLLFHLAMITRLINPQLDLRQILATRIFKFKKDFSNRLGLVESVMKGLARVSSLLVSAAVLAIAVPAPAEDAVPRASEYLDLAKLPDWTGIWYPDWSKLFGGRAAAQPQLTPEAKAKFDAYLDSIKEHGPDQYAQAHCIPPGLPGIMQQPYPIEFIYSPGRVNIFTEAYSQVRRIYTDGRKNPEDPDLLFNGNSVGHWDGDTLVIENTGFSLSTFIVAGLEHSDKMRIDERIWREGADQLVDEMTITDPEVLTAPFVMTINYKLDNSVPIREYVCAENNHLITGDKGADIDLGLDPNDAPLEDDPFGYGDGQ